MNTLSDSEKAKGADETAALRLLIKRCSLPLDPSNIEKRPDGEPDLLCKSISGKLIAFEVVRLRDSEIAKIIAAGSAAKTDAFWTSDPSERIVMKKLTRTYRTDYPIELLIYTDGQIVTPDDVIIPTITPIFFSCKGPFRRAWFMGEEHAGQIWQINNGKSTDF